jgi:hypothetical protein
VSALDPALELEASICAERAERVRARTSDPATSHAAARRARQLAADHFGRIRYALQYGGPGTCYDIADRCIGMTHVQIARRMGELEGQGIVVRTGRQLAGKTGRSCDEWALA